MQEVRMDSGKRRHLNFIRNVPHTSFDRHIERMV